jgi:tRNA(fMet)-specific endonuclease VapC
MPGALLDTNAVSDLMRDHSKVTARVAKHSGPIVTSVIVAGEIRYGLARMPVGKKRADLEARAGTILAALPMKFITPRVAEIYGNLKASLEAKGLNVDDNDLWIAATTIHYGTVIVTRDQIFPQIPGLQVEDWSV